MARLLSCCRRAASREAGRQTAGRRPAQPAREAGATGCDALASGLRVLARLLILAKRAFGARIVRQIDVVLVRYLEHVLFKLVPDRFLIDRILGNNGTDGVCDAEQG